MPAPVPRKPPARELHPFVDAFLHTDKTVREILEEHPDFRGPLFEAMRACVGAVYHKISYKDAVNRIQAVPLEGEDRLLVVMFLWLWSSVSRLAGRFVECSTLVQRARALLAAGDPSELNAYLLEPEALLAQNLGNTDRADETYRQALRAMPAASPKRVTILFDYGLFLAPLWREPEVDAEMEALARRNPERHAPHMALRRLIHFTEMVDTGKMQGALAAIEQSQAVKDAQAEFLAFSRQLLGLMQTGALPAGADSEQVRALAGLLAKRPEEALGLLRENLTTFLDAYLSRSAFPAFNLVRAELSCGHGAAARRIMEIRRKRGNTHPFDDFFLARAELLGGNRELAAALFARTLRTVEQHSAQSRLDFELRLSCELSPGDVMWLVRAAGQAPEAVPAEAAEPAASAPPARGVNRLVGNSPAMEEIRRAILRCAPLDAPVLITGETGTGKEEAARAIHESGPRAAGPFIAVNCGAITESLLESELFGHEKGAFTGAARARKGLFEEAGRGTVFLDEIGEMPPRVQVSLLRVLEAGEVRPVGASRSRKVSCRILAATNADLAVLAEKGAFRQDLLFRLRRLEINIPPLRERRADLLPLADHFFGQGRSDLRRPALSEGFKAELVARDWPGNARELRNVVEKLRLLNSDKLAYEAADLEAVLARPAAPVVGPRWSDRAGVGGAPYEGRTALRRRERLREMFRRRGKLTRQEITVLLGISGPTATADLKALCAEGLVERVTPSASRRSHYFRLRAPPP